MSTFESAICIWRHIFSAMCELYISHSSVVDDGAQAVEMVTSNARQMRLMSQCLWVYNIFCCSVQPSYQWTVHVRAICRQSEHALLSSVHMAPSRGRTGNSLLFGSVKACFYIYIYIIYINKSYIQTCAYSPATLCPNCNAIGALLSELYDFEQTAVKRTVTFLYI
jgi:hypothetical protein